MNSFKQWDSLVLKHFFVERMQNIVNVDGAKKGTASVMFCITCDILIGHAAVHAVDFNVYVCCVIAIAGHTVGFIILLGCSIVTHLCYNPILYLIMLKQVLLFKALRYHTEANLLWSFVVSQDAVCFRKHHLQSGTIWPF